MTAYYNEIDPFAAHVLRTLISMDVIAPGEVDTRSIKEVQPDDLRGFTQCHFFAGAGIWSAAARLAGWPDDRPIWSGSCPCQGESLAGKRLGADDPRHLWPDLFRLARARRPAVLVGEQVAAAAGTHWLDRVGADLDDENYAFRAVDIPACAVDAPHQRQRLYWVALDDRERARLEGQRGDGDRGSGWPRAARPIAATDGELSADAARLGWGEGRPEHGFWGGRGAAAGAHALVQPNADGCGRAGRPQDALRGAEGRAAAERAASGLQPDAERGERWPSAPGRTDCLSATGQWDEGSNWAGGCSPASLRNGSFWSDYEWIVSPIDGKARRSKCRIPHVADGMVGGNNPLRPDGSINYEFLVPSFKGRIGAWRLAGNAIVPQLAVEVISSLREALDGI